MTTEQFQQFAEMWADLQGQFNALIGCAMFADHDAKQRDLPRLVERYRDTEQAIDDFLFAVEFPDVDEP